MQARYQHQNHGNPVVSPPSRTSEAEDERLARELQAEEQRRMDEEYAKKLQEEGNSSSSVPPPANIIREERLVDPVYPRPVYAPSPERNQPLLRNGDSRGQGDCWPESDTYCGVSVQWCVWVAALGVAGAIVAGLLILIYGPK